MTQPKLPRAAPAACTIISRNYLSFARILARSYLEHEPSGRFYMFVVDGLPDGVEAGADVTLLGPSDLHLPDFEAMTFYYDVAELCTAVKPTLLLKLLTDFGERQALFLDPDIQIMRPLTEVKNALASANIVFTPNLLATIPYDGCRPTEQDIYLSGTFNLGFVGVSRSSETLQFLSWWEGHLLNGESLVSVPAGLMTDQKWMDLVPSLFDGVSILRDDAYNVAWWNLHHRAVSRTGEKWLVNGRPIAFFHFSGFDPSNPLGYTKENQSRTHVELGSDLAHLLAQYAECHRANGYDDIKRWDCVFNRFDDGVHVNVPLRRIYLRLDRETRERFGNPFHVGGADSFRTWATTPQLVETGLSPFLLSLYDLRFDMWPAYPDVRHNLDDRNGFVEWALVDGGRELKYDPKLMRVDDCAIRL